MSQREVEEILFNILKTVNGRTTKTPYDYELIIRIAELLMKK